MEKFREFMQRKHICSTPGCRNRDTLRFARTEGAHTALFLCRDCVAGAFAAAIGVDTAGCRDINDVAVAVALHVADSGLLAEKGEENGQ